jgi:ribosome-binding protein aMBF1 (putative translation factor)
MPQRPGSATLLRNARQKAGLSQRELARRARTKQSVIARIELGRTSPGWDTLESLVRAAGFDLDIQLVGRTAGTSHMMGDVQRILALNPEDRIREVAAVSRFVGAARRRD